MSKKGPESNFRTKICKELRECNALIYPLLGGSFQREDQIYSQFAGMSDVIMVHRWTGVIFLEFKSEKGKLSAIQKRFLEEVNERVPYSGFVVREDPFMEHLGQIEDSESRFLSTFGSGKELIKVIQELKQGQGLGDK